MSSHKPNIVGCAVGFGAAGTGVGSLIGMWFGEASHSVALRVAKTEAERDAIKKLSFHFDYAGIHTGLVLGLVAGAFAGLAYAFYKRWRSATVPVSSVPR